MINGSAIIGPTLIATSSVLPECMQTCHEDSPVANSYNIIMLNDSGMMACTICTYNDPCLASNVCTSKRIEGQAPSSSIAAWSCVDDDDDDDGDCFTDRT